MSKDDLYKEFKKRFILVILVISIVVVYIQIPVTYFQSRYFATKIDIFFASTLTLVLLHYYIKRDIEKTSYFLALNFYFLSLVVLIVASYNNIFMYKWAMIPPIMIYYLLGLDSGKKYILSIVIFYISFCILALFDIVPAVYDKDELIQITLAVAFFSIMAHYLQKMNHDVHNMLNEKNDQLQTTLNQLSQSHKSLIESEKMASLGSLVAGVSHEINTPIGGSLTGISQIKHDTITIELAYKNNQMDEDKFKNYIKSTKTLSELIEKNLKTASNLVKSFKAISVDQHKDDLREINLKDYIDQVITTLHSELRFKHIKINNSVDENININTYAGIYSQIFSNLILNASKHAFKNTNADNTIDIFAEQNDKNIEIYFKDNGVGVSDDIVNKLFDPFFTTTRGQGGSGLGLNIVYNLITSKLNGTIEVDKSYKNGLAFKISLGELDG